MFPFVSALARSLVWRGALSVLVGILALAFPLPALGGIVFLFGVYALADAGMALMHAFGGDGGKPRWSYILEAIVGAIFGVVAVLRPAAAAAVLLVLLAGWSLALGIIRLVVAYRLRGSLHGEWLLILSGILAVLVGVWIIAAPTLVSALAVVTVIGAYLLVFGVISLLQGFRLRAAVRRHPAH